MSGVQNLTVQPDDDGTRLDRWFKRHFPDVSFGRLQKAMRKGEVRLDGKRVKGKEHVATGQTIRIPPLDSIAGAAPKAEKPVRKRLSDAEVQEVRNWVLHIDDDVIVLNKPAGLPTQGGTGQSRHLDGLLDALRYDAPQRPKLVHRLDKDTSGALLLARNSQAAAKLAKGFASKDTQKTYWAIVKGVPQQQDGRISMLMEKAPIKGNERMIASDTGKKSVTDFSVVERMGHEAAWLALQPLTGRTHQLRLHCAEMGTPIVGDGKYGGAEAYLSGAISKKLHLHSYRVQFPHPAGGICDVSAPLPPHMAASFDMLGLDLSAYEDPFEEEF
ncbi:pseudouridine synthase [Kordiimonas sediminis]|uniref:Pseudouridine synthase n=1 Tax=Kordiimonas sediminis TaxID=1735581 RepID=A0A919AUH1_9PROT|nr:RluA family pseudouridine synthase [Kordiimonas sediminis]GHF24609.1 pseudouridine synthase [Kordiimonas sediminis]